MECNVQKLKSLFCLSKCADIIKEIETKSCEYIQMPMPESLKSQPLYGCPNANFFCTQPVAKI